MALSGKMILVTGATGFLGGALVRRLAADGARVKALVRSPEKAQSLAKVPHLTVVPGDITDAESMRAAATGCEIVFHVAAALRGRLADQRKGNVDGTRNVMLAAAAAGAARVVHVSSIAVYGFGCDGRITEDQPHVPGRSPYNISKSEGETVVRTVGAAKNLAYSIIRPGMIYGPHSGMWTGQMFRLARRRPLIWLGDGSGSAYPIHVDDVAALLLILAQHPAASGEAFNCAPDPSPTWRDFLTGYAKLANHSTWLGLPPGLVRIAAPLLDLALWLSGDPQDMRAMLRYAITQRTYSMDKARQLLGWQPQISLDDGIASCVPWLREQKLLS
jgi:nucleoside-diphosphate-sugar epimerase